MRLAITFFAILALSTIIPFATRADDFLSQETNYQASAPAAVLSGDTTAYEETNTSLISSLVENNSCVPGDCCSTSACGNAGCSCGNCSCLDDDGLLGLFTSDHEFDNFIEPVTNPVFFIDPRSMTRARFVFINQQIPGKSILGGGDFQVYALQVSAALNERFSIIAQKDGFITLQPGVGPSADGWGDIAAGLKYVFIRDTENQFLVSGGLIYEMSNGSSEVFQGNGDGMWNFFVTTGKELGTRTHFVGTFGYHQPNNSAQESTSIFYSLHLDYMVTDKLYALWEMNGIHYTQSGRRIPGLNLEGGDLINLGAGSVAGNDFVSMAIGGAYRWSQHLEFAGAWGFPITGRRDLYDSRTTVTVSLIF